MARPIPGPGVASIALADPTPGHALAGQTHWLISPPGRGHNETSRLLAQQHWLIPSPGLEPLQPQRNVPLLRAQQHWLIPSPGLEQPLAQ